MISDMGQWYISIHALVKRATCSPMVSPECGDISIHALVKRATDILTVTGAAISISIHALVKRATQNKVLLFFANKFQSTPS